MNGGGGGKIWVCGRKRRSGQKERKRLAPPKITDCIRLWINKIHRTEKELNHYAVTQLIQTETTNERIELYYMR